MRGEREHREVRVPNIETVWLRHYFLSTRVLHLRVIVISLIVLNPEPVQAHDLPAVIT